MKNTYCVTARYEKNQQFDNHYYYPWSVLSAEFRVYHLTNLLQGDGLILCVRMGLRGKADFHIAFPKVKKS